MNKGIFVALLLLLPTFSEAQTPSKLIYGGIGASAYSGDLAKFEKWSSSFYLGLKFNNSKRINGNVTFTFGSVTGQNSNYVFQTSQGPATPNKFFKTEFISLNYDLQVNFIKKKNFIAFISQGIGLSSFDPQDEFFNKLIDQLETREEDESYSSISLILPTQLGIIYLFDNGYGFGAKIGFINSATDYLDNIGLWGNKSGNDNILSVKFLFYVPIEFK
ncbi:hypothetical protein QQ008_16265 [Fulvivirgaceae bacterium BMA10]|uniref:Outer membrane protein beta-barrel domain-containing protein n=1 Tax=Splendidivirga corallicola TaxID=3051826 RepID=A0ABT8KQC1_9BACT|nr:hypothetical protein [Fulvivirgaceae bacterium BMA10]